MTEMQEHAVKERSAYWDNMKGILIFLVVFGHYLWAYLDCGYAGSIVKFIYLFHMPAFIFVSGYFSKSDNSRSKLSIIKLVVIYVIFNTAMMIFSFLLFNSAFQLITPYYSFWYLMCIITWRVTIKYVEKVNGILLISIILALFVGLWPDVTHVFAISKTIVFFPFFIAGYKLPDEKVNTFIINRKRIDYLKGLLLLTGAIYLAYALMNGFGNLSEHMILMDKGYDSLYGLLNRAAILFVAVLMIMSIVSLMPRKSLPFINIWGRNSLAIYILHRFITLISIKAFPARNYNEYYILINLCLSVLTILILGSDIVAGRFNYVVNKVSNKVFYWKEQSESSGMNLGIIAIIVLIIYLSLPVLTTIKASLKSAPPDAGVASKAIVETRDNSQDVIHKTITKGNEEAIKNAVSIAFVGDLILLQDQVRNAYSASTGEYDFNPMFKYAKQYLTEADLAIGIFEGPTAGKEVGYSTSNYDDGIPLHLNYPDSFAKAIKDSGIDLVSTANNHLLDKREEGAKRTLDILDSVGLSHIGSYRASEEKDKVLIIEKDGLRIAFLAYTYGSNGYKEEFFLQENPSLTSILVDPSSKNFDQVKAKVLEDFQRVKSMENHPDLIAVLPHMGTQFMHTTDNYQKVWNDIFIEAGANIIFGDHSHAVQPIEFCNKDSNGKQAIIVNCPGNFANSYLKNDGDATSIVEVYIDPNSKEIICASVVPMYTQSPSNGNFRALPIYSILTDKNLQREISSYEIKRVAEVQEVITSVMLRSKLTLDQVQERYYLFPEGYFRQPAKAIEISDNMKKSELYKLISGAKTLCFVGDSITAGTKNGGYGWQEPLMAAFPQVTVYKEAWGSATTMTLLDKADEIVERCADLYVIAIGTNDVRYRDEKICAMDTGRYIKNVDLLVSKIISKKSSAKIALISPWLSQDNDPYTAMPIDKRDSMLDEYGEALKIYSKGKGYCFINPNPAIDDVLERYSPSKFLIDHIHPNVSAGINLYSEKVLSYRP